MRIVTHLRQTVMLGMLLCVPAASLTAQSAGQIASDTKTQAEVQKALGNRSYEGVKVDVQNGAVTLTGKVDTYADKKEAERRIAHRKGVQSVVNHIDVAAGEVDDRTLQQKLARKLLYVREGFGTLAFDAFTVQVRNGVVTLGGFAVLPVDKDEAEGIVANMAGVRDIIDNIQVAPLSPSDDRIREAEFRAIYGAPQLNRYALDPAKQIRILVLSGRVTLVGSVDNQGDKEVAGIQANGVSGVFHVTNDLQAGHAGER